MLFAAAQTAPAAAAPAPAAAPPPDQVYIPKTWGEVLGSEKAFIAAATPVMAVFLGVLSAVVTAAKCPGMRRPAPVRSSRARR